MPAAPLRDRRVSSKSRPTVSGQRSRSRAPRANSPSMSKLTAAQGVGLSAPVAGAVAALLAALILAASLTTGGRGGRVVDGGEHLITESAKLAAATQRLVQGRFADIGFRVGSVHLQGTSPHSRDEVLQAMAIKPGEPIMGLDLDVVRARVERVGWVEHAKVIRLLPDTVVVAVTERPILAVWQHHGRREAVATDGHVLGRVDPDSFPGLPLIVGDGANVEGASLLPEVLKRPRLVGRLWAVRRVDDRRWDLVLKDGGVVLLPASDEAAALERLDHLDRTARVLELGLARIDLRDANFTVVRPRPAAQVAVSHGV
jgi:cell division protein FtsQ